MGDRVPCPECDGGVVRTDQEDGSVSSELCQVCMGEPLVPVKGLAERIARLRNEKS